MKLIDTSEQRNDIVNLSSILGNTGCLGGNSIMVNSMDYWADLSESRFHHLLAWVTLKKSFNIPSLSFLICQME